MCVIFLQDVSFIADVANVLIESLKEENMYVRAKAAWSLGTLSDALVFNKYVHLKDILIVKHSERCCKSSTHKTLYQCWFNFGPRSTTSDQH